MHGRAQRHHSQMEGVKGYGHASTNALRLSPSGRSREGGMLADLSQERDE